MDDFVGKYSTEKPFDAVDEVKKLRQNSEGFR